MTSNIRSTLITTDRPTYVLSHEIRQAIETEAHHYEHPRAACIEALKIVQKKEGWVPDGAIFAIAEVLAIPASDVEGVATFYSQIFRQPVGRNVIRLCDSVTCYINGYENIASRLQQLLKISYGQTTEDKRFTLIPVCCLGNCDKGPTLMIDDDTHHRVEVDQLPHLLEAYS